MPYQVFVRAADPLMAPAPFPLHDLTLPPPLHLAAMGAALPGRTLLDLQRFGGTGEQERQDDRCKDRQQREVDSGQVTQIAQQGRPGQE
jgi:hypothetical protein